MSCRTVGETSSRGLAALLLAWPVLGLLVLMAPLPHAVAQPATAAEPLRWKLKEGESLPYTMVQELSQETKDAARSARLTTKQTVELHWSVKGVSSEGVADMTWAIDRLRAKVDLPAAEKANQPAAGFEYDSQSGKDPEGPLAASMTPLLKALVGAEFSVKMNARGEYQDVKLPQKLVDSLRQGAGAAGAADPGENFKGMINQVSLVLPEAAPAKGDSWSNQSRFPMPPLGTLVWNRRFTFDGSVPDAANLRRISLDTKISLEPAAGSDVAVKLTSGQRTGEYIFDAQAGRIVSSRVDEKLQMSFSAQGQNIEQTTATVTTMTLGRGGQAK